MDSEYTRNKTSAGLARLLVWAIVLGGSSLRATERLTPVVRAVKGARPSVVNIHGRKNAQVAGTEPGRQVNGMGTGIIIDERGYIVTNYHVVEGVGEILVTLHNRKTIKARLISHDPQTDLAVVKVSVQDKLPVIDIGHSNDLMPGETVIAIGNAYGYNHTVTKGIISALNRTVPVSDDQEYKNLIQTDASINPGNSGGPLLNIDGKMIGINVAVRVGAQGIGFAIPVNQALEIASRLLSTERVSNVSHGIVTQLTRSGLIASESQNGSAAAAAGLKAGDRIRSVDGVSVRLPLDIEKALLERRAGDEVTVVIERDGKEQRIPVVMRATKTSAHAVSKQLWDRVGLRVTVIAPQVFRQYATRYRGGLKVDGVRQGSPAFVQGIRSGDVLVGIHKWETISIDNMAFILRSREFEKSQPVKFYILRDGETLYGYLNAVASR